MCGWVVRSLWPTYDGSYRLRLPQAAPCAMQRLRTEHDALRVWGPWDLQDARCVALACLKSARVLHEAGIVHTDFRLQNIVWLDEEHCMVIDLEDCKAAMEPLPARFRQLIAWDECTLEQQGDQLYFTYASDLYQVGLMLAEVLQPDWSPAARAFVGMLRSARRPPAGGQQDDARVPTAHSSLEHEWLSQP